MNDGAGNGDEVEVAWMDGVARATTMGDIAAHLGVSRQLVSIVLREAPGASPETRERVQEAARELGYSPNLGARTLRQTKSQLFGVAFAPAHATEPDIIEAVYPAVASAGYQVVLSAQTRTRSTAAAVEELVGYRCAAIIVIGSGLSSSAAQNLARRIKVPLVVVGAGEANRSYDVVRSAGDVGVSLAVDHLIGLGHRNIAYVHTPAMPPAALRLSGYLDAMAASGLDPRVVDVPGSDFTEEAGVEAGRILMGSNRDLHPDQHSHQRSDQPREQPRQTGGAEWPTAVVAGNDQRAVGLLGVFNRAGLRVPLDISLTGFDDSRFASLSCNDLTTARQDPEQMAKVAVAAAIRRIDIPALRPSLHVIDPQLVIRSSTAPPRA